MFCTKSKDGIVAAVSIILDNINFHLKTQVLSSLYGKRKIYQSFLIEFGKIRNAFAHTAPLDSKKYLFKKRSVAEDIGGLDDLVSEMQLVIEALGELTKEQPEFLNEKKAMLNALKKKSS